MNHMTIRKKRKEVKKRLGFMTALWMALLSLCLAACGRNSVRRTRQENSPQAECEASQADHMEAEESCLSGELTEPPKDTADLSVDTMDPSEASRQTERALSRAETLPPGEETRLSQADSAAVNADPSAHMADTVTEASLPASGAQPAASAPAPPPSAAAPAGPSSPAPPAETAAAKPPAPVPTSKAAPESSSVSAPAKPQIPAPTTPPPAPSPSACRHRYRSTVIREAGCAYPGLRVYSCAECGKQYEESIPATGLHNWRELTKTIHHEARTHIVHHEAQSHTEWIVDEEAWEEPVTELHSFCNGCGEDLTVLLKTGQIEDYSDHAMQHVERGEMAPGYHMEEVVIRVIYHEEIGHEETVIDVPAWDETVIDEPAWDETQVCGHECTVCGKITEE